MALAYKYNDGNSIDYTPGSDVPCGTIVLQNLLIGIANTDIDANTKGSLAIKGVYLVPKPTGGGTDYAAGVKVYWDAADSQFNVDSGNVYAGKVAIATTTAASTMYILLGAEG